MFGRSLRAASDVTRGLRHEWREIGGMGRFAVIGLAASIGLTVLLGFTITRSARSHLLEARADLLASEVAGLPPLGDAASPEFENAVHQVLGGETEHVKVWNRDGTILYADQADIIGSRFTLSAQAEEAFAGAVTTHISDLTDPAHAGSVHPQLIEVFIPRVDDTGEVLVVVEVEQRLDSLNEALGFIQRNVWLSIGVGVGTLAVFLGALGVARARSVDRRRRQAEQMLGALFRAQEEERQRIVGALHDDVGQPVYRLLYGLEGSRAKLPQDDPVAMELGRLGDLVRQIDGTLRGELDTLHQGLAADAGLQPALRDLAAVTEEETSIAVHLNVGGQIDEVASVSRTALFRAAQEAVVNVRKHAKADNIWITLSSTPGRIQVDVLDDGVGIGKERSLGLTTARERIEALGGGMTVRRTRGGGTSFSAWLPAVTF